MASMENVSFTSGKAQQAYGASLPAFLASLTTSGVVFTMALVLAGLIIGVWRWRHIYFPRVTHLAHTRIGAAQQGILACVANIWGASDATVLHDCGFEALMFVRYLRLLTRIFGIASLVLPPLIMPLCWIDGKGPGDGVTGLDRLAWPNVHEASHGRHWAFCFGMLFLLATTWVLVQRELQQAVWLSHWQRLSRPPHETQLVLLENLPDRYREKAALQEWYQQQLGIDAIRGMYIIADAKELADTMTDAIHRGDGRAQLYSLLTTSPPCRGSHDQEGKEGEEGYETSSSSPEMDPDHPRRSFCHSPPTLHRRCCALVLFKDRHVAWHVAHTVNWPEPGFLVPRLLDAAVDDINFDNLGPSWAGRFVHQIKGYVIVVSLMVAWVPLISSTGALSQLDSIARLNVHARGILSWPPWLKGLVQGIAPQVALSCLLKLFPFLLRLIVRWQKFPTKVAEELAFQQWHYKFLFLFLFFTVSVSVAMTTVAAEIANSVKNIPFILAENLPKAATYFCSYLVAQVLVSCGSDLCQPGALLRRILKVMLPQRFRTSETETGSVTLLQWGTMYPSVEIMASIVIIYAVATPLILPLACLSFSLLAFSHRYNILYVSSAEVETEGKLYVRAMRRLPVAVGVMQIYCLGLFLLNAMGTRSLHSVLQAVTTACSCGMTLLLTRRIDKHFLPLFSYVPWGGMALESISNPVDQGRARKAKDLLVDARTDPIEPRAQPGDD